MIIMVSDNKEMLTEFITGIILIFTIYPMVKDYLIEPQRTSLAVVITGIMTIFLITVGIVYVKILSKKK